MNKSRSKVFLNKGAGVRTGASASASAGYFIKMDWKPESKSEGGISKSNFLYTFIYKFSSFVYFGKSCNKLQ